MVTYQANFAYRLYVAQQIFLSKHFTVKTISQNLYFP
jgi:hypothetical protein